VSGEFGEGELDGFDVIARGVGAGVAGLQQGGHRFRRSSAAKVTSSAIGSGITTSMALWWTGVSAGGCGHAVLR
jgi:hypothetical protein